jgi:type IV pilus assembly protein PilQ
MNSMQLGEQTMTPTTSSNRRPVRARLAYGAALVAAAGLLAAPVWAANTLRDVQFSAGPAGSVEIVLQLDGPASDASVFTTEDPPRIAVDLPETVNQVKERRVAVGSGVVSSITSLEAGGKTRVVVELFQSATHQSRAEGNQFFLSVSGGEDSVAAAVARASAQTDPSKLTALNRVENIDFRRGERGAGKVIVSLSGEDISSDFENQDDGVRVAFLGAEVPDSLAQRLDVADFATPVDMVELRRGRNGAELSIRATGEYEAMAYQSGTDYVVEVTPVSAEAAAEAGIGLAAEEVEYTGVPVTFNFQNIRVRTVLQLIAEESGLNMVAADSVAGNVTLRLINVPWDQALDIVLRARGLDKRRDGNVVWVAPQAELADYEQARADARLALEERAELLTEYIPINYGKAEDIAKLLTEDAKQGQGGSGGQSGQQTRGFLSPRGSVSFDRRTNTLLLNDSAEKVKELKSLIALLDRAVDQVLIEARIVVAAESFARELGARFGISGGYEDDNGNIITSTGSIIGTDQMANLALRNRFAGQGSGLPVAAPGGVGAGITTPSLIDRLNVNLPVSTPGAAGIGFAILGADYLLDLELSALETEGRGEVVSSPRVITANQREAYVTQGREVGFSVTQAGQGEATATTDVEFKEALLELRVTPTITSDGRVALAVLVKKDEIVGFGAQGEPELTKREVSTEVLLDSAQTVVIGGVYEFSSREDLSKVPFLGDIPALGNLFKRKGRSTDKAELLIFVTPRVLTANR